MMKTEMKLLLCEKGSKIEHFGKFILQKPMFLLVKNNIITIYNEATEKTLFFSTFGKLLDELNGFLMRENQVDIQLRSNFIQPVNSERIFAVSPETWNSFLIKHNAAVLLSEKGILVGRFSMKHNINLPFLSALLLGLSRLPIHLGFFVFVAFIPLFFYFETHRTWKKLIFDSFIFSFTYLTVALHWISLVTLPGFIGMYFLYGLYFFIIFRFSKTNLAQAISVFAALMRLD